MIRLAKEEDIEALRKIYNASVVSSTATFDLEEVDYENRKAWFAAHTGRYILLVHEENGVVTGYASLSPYNYKEAYNGMAEVSVYIDEKYRGRHIGEALMKELLCQAKKTAQLHTLLSLITSENEASIQLHKKLGYEFCGRIKKAGKKFQRLLDVDLYEYIL